MRRVLSLVLLILLGGGIAGCGGAAAPASSSVPTGSAKGGHRQTQIHLTNVRLRLQWLPAGYDDPFVLAKAEGLYRKAGLNVKIAAGKGSSSTSETVGNGSDTFGIADASAAALLISKGLPIKLIADFIQTSPNSFVSHSPIRTPKDLNGKAVVSAPGSNVLDLLPAVLSKYGMSLKDVKVDTTSPASVPSVFLKNKNVVMLGVAVANDLAVLNKDPKAHVTLYAKFGVNPLSFGLLTSNNEIQKHPAIVRKFVTASIEAWKLALKDPKAAVNATVRAFPHASASIQIKGLKSAIALLHSSATQGKPLGWMAASDWSSTLALLHRYAKMKTVKPVKDYYTNAFLSQS